MEISLNIVWISVILYGIFAVSGMAVFLRRVMPQYPDSDDQLIAGIGLVFAPIAVPFIALGLGCVFLGSLIRGKK